jgi:hypothetical protein
MVVTHGEIHNYQLFRYQSVCLQQPGMTSGQLEIGQANVPVLVRMRRSSASTAERSGVIDKRDWGGKVL